MVPYGGFWWRVLAVMIDAIVLNIAEGVISAIFGFNSLSIFGGLSGLAAIPSMTTFGIAGGLNFLLMALYHSVMVSSKYQGTLGKLAVGLVVTDMNGNRVRFLRARGRYFATFLSALIFCIGYLMVGWTKQKQGLHDMIAGTLVYKTRDPRQVHNVEGVFS